MNRDKNYQFEIKLTNWYLNEVTFFKNNEAYDIFLFQNNWLFGDRNAKVNNEAKPENVWFSNILI